jgi:predicted nucleotidyltransferase
MKEFSENKFDRPKVIEESDISIVLEKEYNTLIRLNALLEKLSRLPQDLISIKKLREKITNALNGEAEEAVHTKWEMRV